VELERDQLQKDIIELYTREHKELGNFGTAYHLGRGYELAKQFDLAKTLQNKGVLVFPHAGVQDCGYQIAACVHAALDSGADKVLFISVLHAFTEEMEQARRRVAAGGNPKDEIHWGIQGSGIEGRNQEGRTEWHGNQWQADHAPMSWRYFWDAELKRRGIDPKDAPEVIERFPYLAGGKPQELPNIAETIEIAKDAVIVSTADAFHHGIGYGDSPEDSFPPDAVGITKAQQKLEEGIKILEAGDYVGYNQHCVDAKSDARDAGQLFRYLRGSMTGEVVDITYTDASALYKQPPPTWVAAALFRWELT